MAVATTGTRASVPRRACMFTSVWNRRITFVRASLVLAILAAPAIAPPQYTTDTTKLVAPFRAARAAINAAYIALDTRAVGRHFSDSAAVDFQGQVFSGRAAVDAWLANSLQGVSALRFGPSTFMISENEVMDHSSYT